MTERFPHTETVWALQLTLSEASEQLQSLHKKKNKPESRRSTAETGKSVKSNRSAEDDEAPLNESQHEKESSEPK